MNLQAKENQRLLEAPRSQERSKGGIFPKSFQRQYGPEDTFISDL